MRETADADLVTRMNARTDSLIAALRTDVDALRRDFNVRVTVMEDSIKFAMPVHFDFDSSAVREADKPALQRFANIAKKYYPNANITIEGFADPAGSQAYNLKLSRERAEAVRSVLVTNGLSDASLNAVGYGETRLVVARAQKDQPGAEMNRRVVFAIETSGSPITVSAFVGGR
jgi:peptidoglycan-associated lipoprotein